MKKILGLTVAALLVMGLVGGGTWAYFSDTETSTGNQFLAGTLDLGLDDDSGQNPVGSITGTFNATNFAPGESVNATIFVNNEGSIDMASVNLTITHTAVIDGTPGSVDAGGGGDLSDLLKMIKLKTLKYGTVGSPTEINTWDGTTLDDLDLPANEIALGALGNDTEKELFIEFEFDTTADNGCQGDSANITLTFSGLQQ